jgi:hypothetical protein
MDNSIKDRKVQIKFSLFLFCDYSLLQETLPGTKTYIIEFKTKIPRCEDVNL